MSTRTIVVCALIVSLCVPTVMAGIEREIRPIVTLRYSGTVGGTPETRTAVGIFDTGDPADTFSKETAFLLGIPPTTPLNDHVAVPWNEGTTAAQRITSGGWLGATLNGPELTTPPAPATFADKQVRNGDPAHVFTQANTARISPLQSNGIQPWYEDYNQAWSECHTAMAFMTEDRKDEALVGFVDPTNATPIPFAYCATNGGNGRGLNTLDPNRYNPPSAPGPVTNPANLGVDQRASSVSYFANDDSRVPVAGRNDNLGFVHWVPITPQDYATTLIPSDTMATVNAALPVDRQMTFVVPHGSNPTGLVPDEVGSYTPRYVPVDAAGNTIPPTSTSYEVNSEAVRNGNETNPNGFVRVDGSIRVIVKEKGANPGDPEVVKITQDIRLPSQGPRPYGQINIPGLVTDTGTQLIDTGALTTNRTPGNGIIGTDELNQFGQFFDFKNGKLVLIGPSEARIREMRGPGMLFNVDATTTGLAGSAVDQEKAYGKIPQLQINAPAVPGDAIANQAHTSTFRTHLMGSNATYIDEDAMDLDRGGDRINAQSLGADPIVPPDWVKVFFSVDRDSNGQPGSAVRSQRNQVQSAADVFETVFPGPGAGPVASNSLTLNQEVIGLAPNAGPGFDATGELFEDNVTGFDLYTQDALPAQSLSNLDSPIVEVNDDGTANRERVGADRYAHNFDSYFSELGSSDIFRSATGDIFAHGIADIGLAEEDDLDALALFRPSVGPGIRGDLWLDSGDALSPDLILNPANGCQTYDPNLEGLFKGIDTFTTGTPTDLALFSLAPGSPTLLGLELSAADLFITDFDSTFCFFALAESLGLLMEDNLDGLDSIIIPEPSVLALLIVGAALIRRTSGGNKASRPAKSIPSSGVS